MLNITTTIEPLRPQDVDCALTKKLLDSLQKFCLKSRESGKIEDLTITVHGILMHTYKIIVHRNSAQSGPQL